MDSTCPHSGAERTCAVGARCPTCRGAPQGATATKKTLASAARRNCLIGAVLGAAVVMLAAVVPMRHIGWQMTEWQIAAGFAQAGVFGAALGAFVAFADAAAEWACNRRAR
jgi:hypothetical protein